MAGNGKNGGGNDSGAKKPRGRGRVPPHTGKRRYESKDSKVDPFIAALIHRGGNATAAARDIGFPEQTAHRHGFQLLHHPKTQAAMAAHLAQYQVSTDRVVGELARLAFANLQDYQDAITAGSLECLTHDQAAGLVEWNQDKKGVRVKLDKVQALDRLGKYLKLFTERIEVDVTGDLAARIEQARRSAARSLPLGPAPEPLSAPGQAALPGQ